MTIEKSAVTKILSKEDLKHEFLTIVSLLNNRSLYFVDILFGFAWGNEYRHWIPFKVRTIDIEFEIAKAEQLGVWKFGNDNFSILLNEAEIEILFCHEHDIHLSFHRPNLIVSDIIETWKERKILITLL